MAAYLDKSRLEEVLRRLRLADLNVDVRPDGSRWLAIVTSPDFAGKNEGARQDIVWGHVLANMTTEEAAGITFIFANAPDDTDDNDLAHAAEPAPDPARAVKT